MVCDICGEKLIDPFEKKRGYCNACQKEIRKVWDKEDPEGDLLWTNY